MPQERRATLSDIDRLAEIRGAVRENRLSDPSSVTRADYEDFVGRGRVWVREAGGRIVGFSAGDDRDGAIWALFVEEDFHGQGIGTALLARACGDFRREGFTKAHLTTDPGTAAERLYRKLGWSFIGMTEDGEYRFELSLR